MTNLPPMPTDPAKIPEWLRSLPAEQAIALAKDLLSVGPGDSDTDAMFGDSENPPIELPTAPDIESLLELDVRIVDAEPAIWRRMQVRGALTLAQLHAYLQASFGWQDMHLHRFTPGQERFGAFFVTEYDAEEGIDGTPETAARLDQVLGNVGDVLSYEYDFGDGWTHTIRLTDRTELDSAAEDAAPVRCLDGASQGPPEDCGGPYRYNELAEWIRRGSRNDEAQRFDIEDADHQRDWLPAGFDPDAFDPAEVNSALELVARGDTGQLTAGLDLPEPLVALIGSLDSWGQSQTMAWLGELQASGPILLDVAAAQTLVRPWRVLLDRIGDGVTLTAAGYLPPATVEGIFTDLRMSESWIGKWNREDLTPPVHQLRWQGQQLGLLRKFKGRLLPTKAARAIRADPIACGGTLPGRCRWAASRSKSTPAGSRCSGPPPASMVPRCARASEKCCGPSAGGCPTGSR